MAKPDLDDGYFRIAYELMAAVAAAGFNRGAQIVLFEVFAQIYGLARRKEAVLSPSDIAHRTKYDRSNLIRSIRELTKANVLVNVGEVRYRFNKDYETWKLNETPDQRSLRLAYSRFAPTLAKSFAYDKLVEDHHQNVKRLMEEPPEGCVKSDTGYQSDQQTSCVNSDTPSVSNLTHPSHRNTLIANPESIYSEEVALTEAAHVDFPPLTIPPVGIEKGDAECVFAPHTHGAVAPDLTRESEISPPNGSPLRSPEDAALVRRAVDLLRSHLETEHLGTNLIRFGSLPECMSIPGWKWLCGAEKILSPTIPAEKRRSWPYFVKVAANVSLPSAGSAPLNGTPHPIRKETPQERDRRISKGILDSADRIKALEEEL